MILFICKQLGTDFAVYDDIENLETSIIKTISAGTFSFGIHFSFHLLKNALKRDKTFFERVERYGRMFIFNSYLKCKNRKVANATFKRNGSQ